MTLEEKMQTLQIAFDNEKQSLLDTIKSMKDLFSACQQQFIVSCNYKSKLYNFISLYSLNLI